MYRAASHLATDESASKGHAVARAGGERVAIAPPRRPDTDWASNVFQETRRHLDDSPPAHAPTASARRPPGRWPGRVRLALGLSVLSHPLHAAAVGDPIDEAVAVHVSTGGFEQLGDAVSKVVPETLSIDASSGELACAESDASPAPLEPRALDVFLSVDHVGIDTTNGDIAIALYATLDSSASALTVEGDCTVLTDLDETCGLQLPTTAMNVTMAVDITESAGVFDVTVSDPVFDVSPVGNPLSDCTFASAVGTGMLGQDAELLSNLILVRRSGARGARSVPRGTTRRGPQQPPARDVGGPGGHPARRRPVPVHPHPR